MRDAMSVAIAATDEDHVDAGDKLYAIVVGGSTAFIGIVRGIRQHATHVHWSVLELDRKLPGGPLRGVTLVAERAS